MILDDPRRTVLAIALFALGALAFLALIRAAGAAPAPELDQVVAFDHADHTSRALPVVLAQQQPDPSLVGDAGAATWDAWRAGWVGVAAMLLLWFAGTAAITRKGYIVKRWPWLDDGRAWAALVVVLGALVTLIPLGIAGDLGIGALKAQGALAAGLFLQGDMTVVRARAEDRKRGAAGSGEGGST